MKKWVFIILVALLAGIAGCDKEYEIVTDNPDVDEYIQQLKSGEYDSYRLPEFTSSDIPALLQYRNEKFVITRFPINPISSYYMAECSLGIYVLWTIESIRAKAIESKFLIIGFPSQNPVLARRDEEGFAIVNDQESHEAAAIAYFRWWKDNSWKSFEAFSHIDPLANTNYRWH
jgi:hypothetical protein